MTKYFWYGVVLFITLGVAANLLVWFWPRQQTAGLELPSYPLSQVAAGKALYKVNCATCHGVQGAGNAQAGVPALNGSMHAWHHPDAQIASFIRNGVGQMGAVGPGWTEKEVDAVLSYIKQWWDPEQLAYQTESSRQNP